MPSPYRWQLPPGFPMPVVPRDNPMNQAKVELGRRLFYDAGLSGNGTLSCAGCHRQERAFSDGLEVARGSTGELHPRNAMSLTNVAYNRAFAWADPGLGSLEDQALVPMLNEHPVELGLAGRERELLERLGSDPVYPSLFAEAFPVPRPLRFANVVRAIAAFERTLLSGNSPYDRLVFWDERDALSPSALRGMRLFFSERTRCSGCHAGFNFSGAVAFRGGERVPLEFHNTGLFDLDGLGAYPRPNRGLFEHTKRPRDMGRFKAPTLRNIELTAPYLHDGSAATLEDVIDNYAAGGRGAGRANRYKSELVGGFEISAVEKSDLVEFLKSLTDRSFVTDPRFSDPFSE